MRQNRSTYSWCVDRQRFKFCVEAVSQDHCLQNIVVVGLILARHLSMWTENKIKNQVRDSDGDHLAPKRTMDLCLSHVNILSESHALQEARVCRIANAAEG